MRTLGGSAGTRSAKRKQYSAGFAPHTVKEDKMDRVFLYAAVTALVLPFYALAMILAAFGFQRLSNLVSQVMAGVGLCIAIIGLLFWLIYAAPYIT